MALQAIMSTKKNMSACFGMNGSMMYQQMKTVVKWFTHFFKERKRVGKTVEWCKNNCIYKEI